MLRRHPITWLGILVWVLAACGPAATPTLPATAAPQATPRPTATVAATSVPTPTARVLASPTPTPSVAPAAATPKPGGTVRLSIRSDPPTKDPHKTNRTTQLRQASGIVFSGLGDYSWPGKGECGYQAIPDVAESWRWVSDTTMEVKLRQGVRFQDKPPVNGRELVAQDVVYSYNRNFKAGISSSAEILGPRVKNIEAPDRYTVRFQTDAPFAGLVFDGFASPWGAVLLAKESGGAKEEWTDPVTSWVGVGPFQLENYQPAVKMSFKKHPNYFRTPRPYIDGVEVLFMPDMSTRMAALVSGKIDIFLELPPTFAIELQRAYPKIAANECPSPSGFVTLYWHVDRPPLNDVRVRRAFFLAMDRQGIIKGPLTGKGDPSGWSDTVMGLKNADFPPQARKYLEYDPTEAKRLLAEAGYPSGIDVEFYTTNAWGSPYNETFESLHAMLAQVGIRGKMTWQAYAQYLAGCAMGDYPDNVVCLQRDSRYSPDEEYPSWHSSRPPAANRNFIKDPVLDKMIEEFSVTLDERKRTEMAHRMQAYLTEQAYRWRSPNNFLFNAHLPTVQDFGSVGDYNTLRQMLDRIWLER